MKPVSKMGGMRQRARTLAQAARDAGVSLWEMMDYARSRKISAQYDLEDFQLDLKGVYDRAKSRS